MTNLDKQTKYFGKNDSYTAVLSLDGVCGSYMAITPKNKKVFIKAFDKCEEEVRTRCYPREIEALTALRERKIAPQLLDTGRDRPLVVLPFITGKDLEDELENYEPLPKEHIKRLMIPIAQSMSKVHESGWVHRDLKPENIRFSSSDGQLDYSNPRIIDWGFSYNKNRHKKEQHNVGTPTYMAPEQVDIEPTADERTDVYAMGIIIYRMATGISPYRDCKTVREIIFEKGKILDPRRKDIFLDNKLSELIIKATYPEPDLRYQTMNELEECIKDLDKMMVPTHG